MKQKPTNPAKVDLKHVKSFFQGYARMFSDSFGILPLHKKEQVIWREQMAKACTDNKACLYCGCETPAKYYSDEACEDPVKQCYPEMMKKTRWNQFKKANNITIKID